MKKEYFENNTVLDTIKIKNVNHDKIKNIFLKCFLKY